MFINKQIILFCVIVLLFTSSCIKDKISDPSNHVNNFNLLWKIVDENYCYFQYKSIDWDHVKAKYEGKVHNELSDQAFFNICADMLNELQDGHVNLISDFDRSRYWNWYLDYPQNYNQTLVERNYLGTDYLIAGRMMVQNINGIGYLRYASFMDQVSSKNIKSAILKLGEIKGLIIDIRNNGGGAINMVDTILSNFCLTPQLVGYIRYKEGPGHNNFSEYYPHTIQPKDSPAFTGNIVVLTNRLVYSAANDFVSAMKSLPNVTIIGDKTGGGAGTPFSSELYNGWSVRLSRDPMFNNKKEHIEFGVDPDAYVQMDEMDEFNGVDSMIEYAISYLKNK